MGKERGVKKIKIVNYNFHNQITAHIVLGPNLVSGQGSPQCIYLPEELDRRQDILHITISFLNDGYLQKLIMTSFFFLLAQV